MLKPTLALSILIAAAAPALGADDKAEAKHKLLPVAKLDRSTEVDFEKEILPVLSTSCLACHNKSKPKGGLILETPADIRKGGDTGPAAVAGKSGESLMFLAAVHDTDTIMPPAENKVAAPNLTPEQLALLKLWIDQGAKGEVKGNTVVAWKALPANLQPIYAVAVTSDGQYAACGRGGQVFVYELASGQLAARLTDPTLSSESNGQGAAHRDLVQSLAFSPDGKLLATGGYREIKLWTRPTPAKKAELEAGGCVAASADGKLIAIGTKDGVVRLFDASGKAAGELTGHEGAVLSVRFSVDGSRIVTGGADKTVRVWDVEGRKLFAKADAGAQAKAVAFSGAGKQVAAASGSAVKFFKLPTEAGGEMVAGKESKATKGHDGAVNCLDSTDSQVVSGGEDGKVIIWGADGNPVGKPLAYGSPVASVAIRKDGKRIASAGKEAAAKLWDLDDPKKPIEIKGDAEKLQIVAMAERMASLASADAAYRKSKIADAEKSEKSAADRIKKAEETLATAQKELDAKKNSASAAEPKKEDKKDDKKPEDKKPDDKKKETDAEKDLKKAEQNFASAEDDLKQSKKAADEAKAAVAEAKKIADEAEAEKKARESAVADTKKAADEAAKPIRSVSFSSDGGTLVTVGESGAIHTWSSQTGAPAAVFGERKGALAAAVMTTGGTLIALPADGKAGVYDLAGTWSLAKTLGSATDANSPLSDRVNALAFTPDSKKLISGGGVPSRGGEIRVWDVASGKVEKSMDDIHSDTVLSLDVSPDGKKLLSGSADHFVRISDLAGGKMIRSFEGHTNHVLGVAWKKDGRVVVSSGSDNTVRFWDAETGDRKKPIQGFDKEVTAIAFLGDTDQAVCTSGDPKVKTVKDGSGDGGKSFAGPTDFVHALAVTPDGKMLIAGGEDGVLRAWTVTDGKLVGSMGGEKK